MATKAQTRKANKIALAFRKYDLLQRLAQHCVEAELDVKFQFNSVTYAWDEVVNGDLRAAIDNRIKEDPSANWVYSEVLPTLICNGLPQNITIAGNTDLDILVNGVVFKMATLNGEYAWDHIIQEIQFDVDYRMERIRTENQRLQEKLAKARKDIDDLNAEALATYLGNTIQTKVMNTIAFQYRSANSAFLYANLPPIELAPEKLAELAQETMMLLGAKLINLSKNLAENPNAVVGELMLETATAFKSPMGLSTSHWGPCQGFEINR